MSLPQHDEEFRTAAYWNSFYEQRQSEAFEWYGSWNDIKGILGRANSCTPEHRVLEVGCGNSDLATHMWEDGFINITCIDYSEVAIKELTEKNDSRGYGVQYLFMDMTQMTFSDKSFDVVLDKGALDAIYADESESGIAQVRAMFAGISRVLKDEGRYVIVSLLQSHIVTAILDYFVSDNHSWSVSVQSFNPESGSSLCPFVIICTKTNSPADFPVTVNDSPCSDTPAVHTAVQTAQHHFLQSQTRQVRSGERCWLHQLEIAPLDVDVDLEPLLARVTALTHTSQLGRPESNGSSGTSLLRANCEWRWGDHEFVDVAYGLRIIRLDCFVPCDEEGGSVVDPEDIVAEICQWDNVQNALVVESWVGNAN